MKTLKLSGNGLTTNYANRWHNGLIILYTRFPLLSAYTKKAWILSINQEKTKIALCFFLVEFKILAVFIRALAWMKIIRKMQLIKFLRIDLTSFQWKKTRYIKLSTDLIRTKVRVYIRSAMLMTCINYYLKWINLKSKRTFFSL